MYAQGKGERKAIGFRGGARDWEFHSRVLSSKAIEFFAPNQLETARRLKGRHYRHGLAWRSTVAHRIIG